MAGCELETDYFHRKTDDPVIWARNSLLDMMGTRFCVVTSAPTLAIDDLYPEERKYVAGAVAQRQAEFSTARVCARKALLRFGEQGCDLTPYENRSPRWPSGFLGSISHVKKCCAVAVTNDNSVLSCGIDVEDATPLPPDLEELICTRREMEWLLRYERSHRGLFGKLLFSAKEAFFKCQFPVAQASLEFKDVDLEFDDALGKFWVVDVNYKSSQEELVKTMRKIVGRFAIGSDLITCVAILNAEE